MTKIKCNTKHSYAISTEGELFSWGSNRYYELGHIQENGYHQNTYHQPTKVKFDEIVKVEEVEVGLKHSIFLTNDKTQLYITGDNKKGLFPYEERVIVKLKKLDISNKVCGIISQVKSGWNNLFILTNENQYSSIYCYGDNTLNQLCSGDKKINHNIIKHNDIIENIYIGSDFGYFTDVNKDIYSWGWNEHYNLLSLNNKQLDKLNKVSLDSFNSKKVENKDYVIKNIMLGGAYCYFIFNNK